MLLNWNFKINLIYHSNFNIPLNKNKGYMLNRKQVFRHIFHIYIYNFALEINKFISYILMLHVMN